MRDYLTAVWAHTSQRTREQCSQLSQDVTIGRYASMALCVRQANKRAADIKALGLDEDQTQGFAPQVLHR